MSRARLSPQARVDLLEIWHFIAKDSLQNGSAVYEDIKAGVRLVAEMPGVGHTRSDIDDETLLFWNVHSYLIAYRRDTKPVQVVRIVSGRRDLKKLFEKR